MNALDKHLLIVTGKGGTGKTTVAAALGMRSARQGHRTLLVECNGTQHIGPLLGAPPSSYTPQQLGNNLFGMTITSNEAIEDFIIKQIKVRALYSMVFRNRVMGPFMDAVPGLHDAVHLGKVYDLLEEEHKRGQPAWDRVIVDAPATGHGLHILNAPKSMMELTRRGPIHKNAKLVHDLTSNTSKTGIVMTCLPESMPVSETLHLHSELTSSGYEISAVVLNEMLSANLPDTGAWASISTTLRAHHQQPTIDLVDRFFARDEQQNDAQATLGKAIPAPLYKLPLLVDARIQASSIATLSRYFDHRPTPQ